jgi:monovalent cation:H+ antiporter, CPA1 family
VAMSDTTREYVDMFWELIDEILNAVLFVLIGMEVLLFPFTGGVLLGGLIAVGVTLAARWLSVGAPVAALHRVFHALPDRSWRVLTWGGLRGGISVALALSLPPSPARDLVLALTYCVVVVSILVQGLTIGAVVRTLPQR